MDKNNVFAQVKVVGETRKKKSLAVDTHVHAEFQNRVCTMIPLSAYGPPSGNGKIWSYKGKGIIDIIYDLLTEMFPL